MTCTDRAESLRTSIDFNRTRRDNVNLVYVVNFVYEPPEAANNGPLTDFPSQYVNFVYSVLSLEANHK